MQITKKILSVFLAALFVLPGLGVLCAADGNVEFKTNDIVQFGSYPQKEVKEQELLDTLNLMAVNAVWKSYGYYSGTGVMLPGTEYYDDGEMIPSDYMQFTDVTVGDETYRGVKIIKYRPGATGDTNSLPTDPDAEDPNKAHSFQDENFYFASVGNTYWFQWEPLLWRVLDPDARLALCETIIDSQPYHNYLQMSGQDPDGSDAYWGGDANPKYYANNYARSDIRAWLTEGFFNAAFTEDQQDHIYPTVLDNSAYSSERAYFGSATTTDKVFLLSWEDVQKPNYGFLKTNPASRIAYGSDYAKCQGLAAQNMSWRLRTAGETSALNCGVDAEEGNIDKEKCITNETSAGIRPAMRFDLQYAYENTVSKATFVADGETVDTVKYTVTTESIKEPQVPPKDGYDGAWEAYTLVPGGITVRAVYSPVRYKIDCDLNGGALANGKENPTGYTIEDDTIELYNPTRTGYDFAGWTGTGLSDMTSEVTIKKGSTGDKAFTANWTPIVYTITYRNIATLDTPNPENYTCETETFTLHNPTKAGHTFKGWFGTGISDMTSEVTVEKGSIGDREYTAFYDINMHNVTVENDGNGTATAQISGFSEAEAEIQTGVQYNSTVKLTAYPNPGYAFDKWTSNDEVVIENDRFLMPDSDVTVKACFTIETYTITCDLNGGVLAEGETNEGTYDVLSAPITLANPTRAHYTFTGWTGSNGSTPQTTVTIPTGSTGNRTYTANWDAIGYTISYDLDGGTADNPTSYTIETETFELADPARTGYTFTGWSGTDLTGDGNKIVMIEKGSTGDRAYTAHWTINKYSVTVQDDGKGTASADKSADVEYGATVTLTATPKKGYVFDKWTGCDVSADNTFVMPDDNVTVKATFKTIPYTIRYELNGGTAENPTEYNVETVAFILNKPIREGYSFNGWSGTGLEGDGNQTVLIANGSTGDRSYEANWTLETYQLTYDAAGGSFEVANPESYTCETETFTLTNPTRTGYTFKGWSGTELTGDGNKTVTIQKGSTGDRSYTATWIANTFTLTFDPNGGTIAAENGFEAGTDAQAKTVIYAGTYGDADATGKTWPADPKRDGYTFAGWKSGSTVFTATGTVSITQDTTLTADWSLGDFTLTIEYKYASGETASATYTSQVSFGTSYNVTSPVIEYYTADQLTVTGTMDTAAGKSVTVTYSPIEYKALFVADGSPVGEAAYTVKTVSIKDQEPVVPGKEGYTGAWESYVLAPGGIRVNAVYTPNNYALTIEYKYANGETASATYTSQVAYGGSYEVTSPAIDYYKPDQTKVTGAMDSVDGKSVIVTYSPIEYKAAFVADGSTVAEVAYTIKTESIKDQEPAVPAKDGYTGAWETYTLAPGGIKVNAVYTPNQYDAVLMADGRQIGVVAYNYGQKSIQLPDVPKKDGYEGTWPTYTLPVGGTTINAVYTPVTYIATFVADDKIVAEVPYTVETTSITEPAVPAKKGFTGVWQPYTLKVGGVTVVASYTPEPVTVTRLEIITGPKKTVYTFRRDKDVNLDGMVVKVYYSDGTEKTISGKELEACRREGYSAKPRGVKDVTIFYGEKSVTFRVTVKYRWWQWLIIIFLFGWIWYIR